jgi:hypothetical protein
MHKKIPTGVGILLIVIITVTVAVLVLKYAENKTIESNSQVSLQDTKSVDVPNKVTSEISNESVASYKNTTYNYEINIPIKFNVKTASLENPDSLIKIISKKDNRPLFSISAEVSKFKDIDGWLNGYQQTLSQMNYYEGVRVDPPIIISKEEIRVGGADAVKVVLHNMPYSDYLIAFIKNGLLYTISYNGLLTIDEENVTKKQSENQETSRSKFQLNHRAELDKITESFQFVK